MKEDTAALTKALAERDVPAWTEKFHTAKVIVDSHGGTLRAESPGPGKGATFTVELPLGSTERRGKS